MMMEKIVVSFFKQLFLQLSSHKRKWTRQSGGRNSGDFLIP